MADSRIEALRTLAGYHGWVGAHKEAFDVMLEELIKDKQDRAQTAQQCEDQNKLYKWANEIAPIGAPPTEQAVAQIVREAAGKVGMN